MRRVRDRLEDVMVAIRLIEREAVGGRDLFVANEMIQVWMVHHIQIIGEAIRAVSSELGELDSATPWPQIVGMRHILVHDYFGIDLDEVWNVIERDIPSLRIAVERILADLSTDI